MKECVIAYMPTCTCICTNFLQGTIQLIAKWEEYMLRANKLGNDCTKE